MPQTLIQPRSTPSSTVFQAALLAMVAASAVLVVQGWIIYARAIGDASVLVNRDFNVYYFAAKAFWSGHDPYDLQFVSLSMPKPAWSPFVYPPYALYLFFPLIQLNLTAAMLVWLAIKLIAVGFLIAGWRKLFRDLVPLHLLLPLALIAFSGAIVYDIHTGNIGTIEAAFLIWAFYFLDRDRPLAFVLCVVAAAAMKMVPLVFLAAPFFVRPFRESVRLAATGLAIMTMVIALTYLAAPSLTVEWLFSAKQVDWMSRSFYALAVQGQLFIDPAADQALVRRVAAIVQFALAGLIVLVTWRATRGRRPDALLYAVVILALLLCWPRLWRYAFANAIGPILVIAVLDSRNGWRGVARAIAMVALTLLPQGNSRADTLDQMPQVFEELAATVFAWGNGLWLLARRPQALPRRASEPAIVQT